MKIVARKQSEPSKLFLCRQPFPFDGIVFWFSQAERARRWEAKKWGQRDVYTHVLYTADNKVVPCRIVLWVPIQQKKWTNCCWLLQMPIVTTVYTIYMHCNCCWLLHHLAVKKDLTVRWWKKLTFTTKIHRQYEEFWFKSIIVSYYFEVFYIYNKNS